MKRRDFLKGIGSIAAAEAVISAMPVSVIAQEILLTNAVNAPGLSILQGVTTDTTTQLSIDLPRNAVVEYSLVDQETRRKVVPSFVRPTFNSRSEYRVDCVIYQDLELGHRYEFTVIDKESNRPIDQRFLKTVDMNRQDVRIAVVSCMNHGRAARGPMWAAALAADPDYFFFIGDVVYGDFLIWHSPDILWARFIDSRAKIPFYRWKNLKPVVAVWDDHDYGKNNEDGNYKHKKKNLEIFKTFLPQAKLTEAFDHGPGNSKLLKAFGQNFLFLDSRTYRTLPDQGITGFLGQEQLSWASGRMANLSAPTWLIAGSPFFGRTEKGSTSYQTSAPEELENFLHQIRSWNSPAIFLGGDLHYSEISRLDRSVLGYPTYEFISSCMHSSTKTRFFDNPHPQVAGYLNENFLIFQKQGLVEDPVWNVTCVAAGNAVPFRGEYRI